MKRRSPRAPHWRLETDLCAATIALFRAQGWKCYPEQDGWDFLMVDPKGGYHGVQAKLAGNMKVLQQAIQQSNVNHSVVLIGRSASDEFFDLARALKLEVLFTTCETSLRTIVDQYLGRWLYGRLLARRQSEVPVKVLPPETDRPAGCQSPSPLTTWKMAAVRFCMEYKEKTFTNTELRKFGIGQGASWVVRGWAERIEVQPPTRLAQYRLVTHSERPDTKFPDVVEIIQQIDASKTSSG